MTNKRIAKHPLLYIDQPTVNTPKASMQSTYQSSSNKSTDAATPEKKLRTIQSQPKRIRKAHHSLTDDNKKNIASENNREEQVHEEKKSTTEEVGSLKFKDMSLQQKVSYFSNKPAYTPKLKCEVKTGERSFRGVITDFDDDHVYMRIGNRVKTTSILMKEIKDIRMMGF